jgi:hypothetical protein
MTDRDREMWIQIRRGLLTAVAAIEHRYGLPRGSMLTIGAAPLSEATQSSEPPQEPAFARSSEERVG